MHLIDSHCHLPLIVDESRGVDEIIAAADAADVKTMLCVNVQMETMDGVFKIAAEKDNVFSTVGVHPNTDESAHDPTVDELVEAAKAEHLVAIGETGLDYFRSDGQLDWQRERFRTHIRAAREINKPLVIHTREASQDTLAIMREEGAKDVGGVMHCFVDDWDTASAAMDLGFYISFSGIVTFKNAGDLKEVAKQVPAERLLIETDSPWLAPVPKRGKTNEPSFVRYTAEYLADLRSTSLSDIADTTTDNFRRLFLSG